VGSRLLKVDAFARAVERNLALLAATLRADTAMDRRTKAFLFPQLANGATHWKLLGDYGMRLFTSQSPDLTRRFKTVFSGSCGLSAYSNSN
jgi:hypothetical protein